jgi:hypothetical protein
MQFNSVYCTARAKMKVIYFLQLTLRREEVVGVRSEIRVVHFFVEFLEKFKTPKKARKTNQKIPKFHAQ